MNPRPGTPVARSRLARAKTAYSVRRVDLDRPLVLACGAGERPRHGDLVLAQVVALGQHTRLELTTSRRAALYVGDEVVVAYGARYAPDQFEAELPDDLAECDLVAAGGCAAHVRGRHTAIRDATRLRPVGLLRTPEGHTLNVADGALPAPPRALTVPRVPTVLVAGTSMNAGKTTTVSALVRGLTHAGLRVGAGKITGTGAGGDRYGFVDAGAAVTLDFTDLGLVATYRVPVPRLARLAADLHDHLLAAGVDAVVLEIADGVLQPETCALLEHAELGSRVDGALFAAADAAGAVYGVQRMHACGQRVVAVSGLVTASPLARHEVQCVLDVPVYGSSDLSDPALATALLDRTASAAPRAVPAVGA